MHDYLGILSSITQDSRNRLIRGLNRKSFYFDVFIANPTSITYLKRRSVTEEHRGEIGEAPTD